MCVKLLTEHHLEFLCFEGVCTGSSESTLVKMPHCWKSHVAAHLQFSVSYLQVLEGYGQTECGAICSLQMPGDGTIGKNKPAKDI